MSSEQACLTTIGDRVKLKKGNNTGEVKFIGEVKGKTGVYYGIELDSKKGDNNGTLHNIKYFKTRTNCGIFVKSDNILKTNCKHNSHSPRILIGDKVKCIKTSCNGLVKFIGTPYPYKSSGIYYGLQLEKPKGTNNGTIKSRYYFKCKSKYGIFVQSKDIKILSSSKKKKTKQNKVKDKKTEKEIEHKIKKSNNKSTKLDYRLLYLEMKKENERLKEENRKLKQMLQKQNQETEANSFIFMFVSFACFALGG